MINNSSNISELINKLILTCQTCNINYFKDTLYEECIETSWPNKESFKQFFCQILNTAKPIDSSMLTLKIQASEKNSKTNYYFFQDGKTFPSITIILDQTEEKLFIDLLPF